nr:hypothetical protein [Streptomyces acidicola]
MTNEAAFDGLARGPVRSRPSRRYCSQNHRVSRTVSAGAFAFSIQESRSTAYSVAG